MRGSNLQLDQSEYNTVLHLLTLNKRPLAGFKYFDTYHPYTCMVEQSAESEDEFDDRPTDVAPSQKRYKPLHPCSRQRLN